MLGYKINGSVSKFAQRHPRKHEFFFNTDRKRMSVIHEYEGEDWIFAKGGAGGFKKLVKWKVNDGKIVPIEDGDFENASEANRIMASKAMRVIALCAEKFNQMTISRYGIYGRQFDFPWDGWNHGPSSSRGL